MKKLPIDKQLPFFKVIMENGSLKDLENWIYQESSLSDIFGDDYYELISLDFNQKFVLDDIQRIICPYIDYTNYSSLHLKNLLLSLQITPNDFETLAEIYQLYCKGYYFLGKLAIDYGLCAEVELIEKSENGFSNYSLDEIKRLSKLIFDAINEKKIVLVKCPDYEKGIDYYQDFRSEEEKRLTNVMK